MSEATETKEFVKWWKASYPQHAHCLRVSMAGLPRHGKKGAIQWSMMKGQGVQSGESDLLIALKRNGYGSLVIEHKKAGGTHKVSDEQQKYLDAHEADGNLALSTRGLGALKAAVIAYMGEGT